MGNSSLNYGSVAKGDPGATGATGATGPAGPAGTTGYGTSLPGSPTDGLEYVLVDSTTSPTYQWRFRYNANSTNTDKWEFVGGAPLYGFAATQDSKSNSASFTDPTNNVSLTVPRAGVYKIEYTCMFERGPSASGSGGNAIQLSIAGSPDTNTRLDYYGNAATNGGTTDLPLGGIYVTPSEIAASSIVKFQYQGASDNTVKISLKRMAIYPVRVS